MSFLFMQVLYLRLGVNLFIQTVFRFYYVQTHSFILNESSKDSL